MNKKFSRTFTEIVNLMMEKPVYLRMGKGKLSKRFKCSQEEIIRANRTFTLHKQRIQSKTTDIIIGFVISDNIFPAYV